MTYHLIILISVDVYKRQFLKIETMKYNFDKVIDRSGTSAEKDVYKRQTMC